MTAAAWDLQRRGDELRVCLTGAWRMRDDLPGGDEVFPRLDAESGVASVCFDVSGVDEWDTGLLIFLLHVADHCRERDLSLALDSLPEGIRNLVDLARAVPERAGAARTTEREPWLARLGSGAVRAWEAAQEQVTFVGDAVLALAKFFVGRASYRRSDFWVTVQDCGANALGIVTLISVLVGLILAFVGAVQLRTFGASIYVADLVGIGMARQMGAIMTGIIMAGRTGAAFAAQLGTMTVNEEIDALRTLGVSPMEFLVLPRMLALILMMPLLCLYSDLMGIVGGFIVGITMLDLSAAAYIERTLDAVALRQFAVGLVCATVFGVLVALAGCLRGMQCGKSAQAVGLATTSAVVTGIVWIVVSDGILTVVFDVIGI